MKFIALVVFYALIELVNYCSAANANNRNDELKRFTARPANFSLVLIDESKQRDDFFKHLKYLTSRFVDYKFFCSSEINLKSQYAILDDASLVGVNRSQTVHELNSNRHRGGKQQSFTKSLRTTNVWVLRNKKCMNFSDSRLNFNEANSVCVRNNYKVTRMLHRNEMKFLVKNGKDHYKGIDIYALYAKLNRVRRVKQQQQQQTSLRKKSNNREKKLRRKSALANRRTVKKVSSRRRLVSDVLLTKKKMRRQNEPDEEEEAPTDDEDKKKERNQNCDDEDGEENGQLVQEFHIWLNDDNYLTGDECLTKNHAPVVRFNQRECRNGCYECALRNTTLAYFVCVKNCDWKVPYNSFCNTMNRNDFYLYENLYYQRDELIYLCQGQLECVDYACKCPELKRLRKSHFCD